MQSAGRVPSLVINPRRIQADADGDQERINIESRHATVMMRTLGWRLQGKYPMFIGQALIGRLMEIVQSKGD